MSTTNTFSTMKPNYKEQYGDKFKKIKEKVKKCQCKDKCSCKK